MMTSDIHYRVIVDQFLDISSSGMDSANANYKLDILAGFRYDRFLQSIQQNPNFFNGLLSGVLVQPAAYTFIYRFMANTFADCPEEVLNQEIFKSFFVLTGT
jgi:hypothetical protein